MSEPVSREEFDELVARVALLESMLAPEEQRAPSDFEALHQEFVRKIREREGG